MDLFVYAGVKRIFMGHIVMQVRWQENVVNPRMMQWAVQKISTELFLYKIDVVWKERTSNTFSEEMKVFTKIISSQ